jgi:hypothetical protein
MENPLITAGTLMSLAITQLRAQKPGVISTLMHRCISISDEEYVEEEMTKITQDLMKNGYKKQIINSRRRRVENCQERTPETEGHFISVPYIKGVSERCSRILRPYGIKLANKSSNTLRSVLSKVKDKQPTMENTGVVYQVPCKDCHSVYIGETGKEIGKRIREHERAINRRDNLSKIFQHMDMTGHTMRWEQVAVLDYQRNTRARKCLALFYTKALGENASTGLWMFRPNMSL